MGAAGSSSGGTSGEPPRSCGVSSPELALLLSEGASLDEPSDVPALDVPDGSVVLTLSAPPTELASLAPSPGVVQAASTANPHAPSVPRFMRGQSPPRHA